MAKIVGTDTAMNIFQKEVKNTSVADAARTFNLPLQVAYALASGHNALTPVTIRRILAVEANRQKKGREADALARVEANQYKGHRDTTRAIEKRNEKYYRDTMPDFLR